MRNTIVGMLAGAALVAAGIGFMASVDQAQAQAGSKEAQRGTSDIYFSTSVVGSVQQITLFDAREKTLALYEVDPKDGKISFRSARKCEWDLRLESFNVDDPAPDVIRSEVEENEHPLSSTRQSRRQ